MEKVSPAFSKFFLCVLCLGYVDSRNILFISIPWYSKSMFLCAVLSPKQLKSPLHNNSSSHVKYCEIHY